MGQVSAKLRRVAGGYAHWCPACEQVHVIGDDWTFDRDLERPTFNPSVKVTGKKIVVVDGVWLGGWVRDANGNPVDDCCHYFLHAGELKFQADSLHGLAGKTVPLPDLPAHLRDTGC